MTTEIMQNIAFTEGAAIVILALLWVRYGIVKRGQVKQANDWRERAMDAANLDIRAAEAENERNPQERPRPRVRRACNCYLRE